MSKMLKCRIVNLNYNNNTMKIPDLTFNFEGENTLLNLINGGGKTVLVQNLVALFVDPRMRQFKTRTYESYFTTKEPTIVMVEWLLDNNKTHFITGALLRKSINPDSKIDMYTFTGEYAETCEYSIDNIPIVQIVDGKKALKSYSDCKKALEDISNQRNDFRLYDMMSSSGRTKYYQILAEHQINHKEWESIVYKINKDESGLSDLFTNSNDERKLVENWFLKPIEDKLNQDGNKIKRFQELTRKFILQYKSNKTRIEQKKSFEEYLNDTAPMRVDIEKYIKKNNDANCLKIEMILYTRALDVEINRLSAEIAGSEAGLASLRDELKQIACERLSYEYYCNCDKKDEADKERAQKESEIAILQDRRSQLSKNIDLYNLNRLYRGLKDFEREKTEIDAEVKKLTEEENASREEINTLGRRLYTIHFEKLSELKANKNLEEEKRRNTQGNEKATIRKQEDAEKKIQEVNKEFGKLQAKIDNFNDVECSFNKDYSEHLGRNIVGLYEDGVLDNLKKKNESELAKFEYEKQTYEKNISTLEKDSENIELEQESERIKKLNAERDLKEQQSACSKLNDEKEKRLQIIRCLDMTDREIDSKDAIIAILDRKIQGLDIDKDNLSQKKRDKTREKESIKSGKTIKLPQNIEECMHQNDIEFHYGMEWLNKNGRTVEENKALVEKNPFIPYSILMERDTFERFSTNSNGIATGLPIPIIIKDELEKMSIATQNGFVSHENIHFYVMFNDKLLDQEELEKTIRNIDKEIAEITALIDKKNSDIEEYRNYKSIINNQTFSEKIYQDTLNVIDKLCEEIAASELTLIKIKDRRIRIAQDIADNKKKIESVKTSIDTITRKINELKRLVDKYSDYVNSKNLLSDIEEEKESLIKKINNLKVEIGILREAAQNSKSIISEYSKEISDVKKLVSTYELYKDIEGTDNIEGTADELEARYKALTKEAHSNLSDLQERQKQTADRILNQKNEITRLNRNNIPEAEYCYFIGTEEQYNDWEEEKTRVIKKKDALDADVHSIDNTITRLEAKKDAIINSLKGNDLVEREKITDIDFDRREAVKTLEISENENHHECLKENLNILEGFYNKMEEYKECNVEDNDVMAKIKLRIPSIDHSDIDTIKDYQSGLRKKANLYAQEIDDIRNRISDQLDRILAKTTTYSEEVGKNFSNWIDSLRAEKFNPNTLLSKLDQTREVISRRLNKLEEDLQSFGADREELLEQLMEYIEDVNENLPHIGDNSTIQIRGISRKMLQIKVPSWEVEANHFKFKLENYIDKVVESGLNVLNRNENLETFVGNKITIQILYDNVVGINNVEIKLFKVEENREVLSTWSDVASHSGGEEFVSGFVILSCLLNYMRNDNVDNAFKKERESKVLIMDNPFAKTYSEHLLKPLMEMSKKTNTQLICLSGMEDGNIYDRFDNIYALSLKESGLNSNLQIMESEHKKVPNKQMAMARFQVEQMSLFDIVDAPDANTVI